LHSVLLLVCALPLAVLLLSCSNEAPVDPLVFRETYHGNISALFGNVGPDRLSSDDPNAPDFRWRDSTGALDSLSNQVDRIVVLTFFAEWCGPCHDEAPSFVSMSQKLKDSSVEFIGVDIDANGDVIDHATHFANLYGIKYQVIADSAFRLYDAYSFHYDQFSIPYTFVIGRDGTVKASHKGVANEEIIQSMISRAE
jgi:cytochrome c biogenesis protein CcmG, thiol:disulfide interchange protein DsbE